MTPWAKPESSITTVIHAIVAAPKSPSPGI
jgi:hypothetical protein